MDLLIKILDFLTRNKKIYLIISIILMLLIMVVFGVIVLFKYSNYDPFIYFQF